MLKFLQFSVSFFKRVVDAKLSSKDITIDWYKKSFLDKNLTSDEIAINSGLNKIKGNVNNWEFAG